MAERCPRRRATIAQRRQPLVGGWRRRGGLMLGASFAAVPLYRAVLPRHRLRRHDAGRRNARRRARRAANLTVRFDANVAPGLAWSFEPETAGNPACAPARPRRSSSAPPTCRDRETAARRAYNVTPDQAGACFDKISCFCFTRAEARARTKTAEWPVVFFLDPQLEQDETMTAVDAITLSYTFFAPPEALTQPARTRRPGGQDATPASCSTGAIRR